MNNDNEATKLLKEFADWYWSTTGDDISGYDQDTTPYAVWEFLVHADEDVTYPVVEADAETPCPLCEMMLRPDHNVRYCFRCGRNLRTP